MRPRWQRGCALVLACGLAIAPARGEEASEERESPRTRWGRLADTFHDWTYSSLSSRVSLADAYFAEGLDQPSAARPSTFRLGLHGKVGVHHDRTRTVDPSFSADIHLPNIEDRMRLIITQDEVDRLPDQDRPPSDSDVVIALQWVGDRVSTSTGVKWRLPPVAYARIDAGPTWNVGQTEIRPRQRFFYDTDEGFGEVTSLSLFRWVGESVILRSTSAVRWTEATDGVEWEQAFAVGHLRGLLRPEDRGRMVGERGASRATGVRASVFGRKRGSGTVERYRLSFIHRRPIHRRWVYLELMPEINWRNETDWREEVLVRAGLDLLIWGPDSPAED